ncbi:hypothetical protein N7936_003020 [Cronobacter sakazakii]|nr:hypothetical protein [Cronobacter sakazakii]ELY6202327.1 hypothetical protein [Cronobacter malonaticus]EJV9474174.1 hypothetical protein [Cronobacter sakazakii]ELY6256202.1 hypothetical protein [Cronobacter malonaticus]NCG99802.1 hypothetical protein [Cronobacter malonaticus]
MGFTMGVTELKHVIALLLEDAKRLQQVEPNAGTEARIWIARRALAEHQEKRIADDLCSHIQRLKDVIGHLETATEATEARERLLAELKLIQTELK